MSELKDLRRSLKGSWSTEQIDDLMVQENEVYNELYKIDPTKASGPDEIPGRLLKERAAWLAEPITELFNLSLRMGSLPLDWKQTNVNPVFKKGNRHSINNYHPVSLTSLIVKILE